LIKGLRKNCKLDIQVPKCALLGNLITAPVNNKMIIPSAITKVEDR
jgi:hypothetical protein